MPNSLCPGPAGQWAFSQKHKHFYRQISHQLIKIYGVLPTLHKIVCNAWLLCHLSGVPLPNSPPSSWYLEKPIPIINCSPSDLGELFRLGGYDSQLDTQWYWLTRITPWVTDTIKTNTFFPPLSWSEGGNLTPVNCICLHFWLFQHTEFLMGKDLSP